MMGNNMTYRARRYAFVFGVLGVLALPKHTPCRAPGNFCETVVRDGWTCTPTDLEPLGVYALEWVLGRDVEIYYKRWLDCP
jgi:hypothetical protein